MSMQGLKYAAVADGETLLVDFCVDTGEGTAGSQEQVEDASIPIPLTLYGNDVYKALVRKVLAQLAPFPDGQSTTRESNLVVHCVTEDKGICYLCVFDITDVSSNPNRAYKFLKRLRKLFVKQHEVRNRPPDPLAWGAVPSFAHELSTLCIKETTGRGRSSSIAVSNRGSDAGLDTDPTPAATRASLQGVGHRRKGSRSEANLPAAFLSPLATHVNRTNSTPLLVRASHASANTGIPADTLAKMMGELGVSNFHDADSFAHVTGMSLDDPEMSSTTVSELAEVMNEKKQELIEHHKLVQYSPVPVTDTDRMEHISLLRESLLRMHEYDTAAMRHELVAQAQSNGERASKGKDKEDADVKFVRQSLLKHASRLHDHFFGGPAQNAVRDGLVDIWGLPFILQSTSTAVHVVDCLVTIASSRVFHNDESTWIDAVYSHPIGTDSCLHSFEVTINGVETHSTILQPADAKSIFHTDYWLAESNGIRDGVVRFLIRDLPPKAEVRITTTYSKRMRPTSDSAAVVLLGSLVSPSALVRASDALDPGLSFDHNCNAALNIYIAMPGEIEHVDLGHDNTVYRQDGKDPSRGIISLSVPLTDTVELYLSIHCPALATPRAWYSDSFKRVSKYGLTLPDDDIKQTRNSRIGVVVCPSAMAPSPRSVSKVNNEDGSKIKAIPTPTEWIILIGTALSPADLRAVTEGVHLLLRSLPGRTLFNVISFGSGGPSTLFETGSVVLNNDSLQVASEFIDAIKPDSHTNLRLALEAANMMPPHTSVPREVIIFTGQSPPNDLSSALESLRQHAADCRTSLIVVDETAKGTGTNLSPAQQLRDIGTGGMGGSGGDGTGPPAPAFAVALRDAAASQHTPGSILVASGEANVSVRIMSLLEVHEFAYARNVTLTWSQDITTERTLPSRNVHVFVDQYTVILALQKRVSDADETTVTIKAETMDPSGTLWQGLRALDAPHAHVLAHAVLEASANDEVIVDDAKRKQREGVKEDSDADAMTLPWCLGRVRTPTDIMAGESISRVKIYELAAIQPSSAAAQLRANKNESQVIDASGAGPGTPGSIASPGPSPDTPPLAGFVNASANESQPKQRKRRSGSVFSRAAAAIRRRSALTVLPWQTNHAIVAKDRPFADLIKHQRADGAWDNLDASAAFLGLKTDVCLRLMPPYLADIQDNAPHVKEIWQTALAVEYIRMKTVAGFHSRWNAGTQETYRRVMDKGHAFIKQEIAHWSLDLHEPGIYTSLLEYVAQRLCESRKASNASTTPAVVSPPGSPNEPPRSHLSTSVDNGTRDKAYSGDTADTPSMTMTLSSQVSSQGTPPESRTESPRSTIDETTWDPDTAV